MSGPGATPALCAQGYPMGNSAVAVAGRALPTRRRFTCAVARLLSVLPLICIIGCATAPEKQIVSSVTTLPPVQVPVPVRCVKPVGGCVGANPGDKCQEMPPVPPATLDPNADFRQRYYQTKADLLALDEYKIKADAVLKACAQP
jgi:hypothetical protein